MATKTKKKPSNQDDPNRIQDDYDQRFNEMTSPENYAKDGEESKGRDGSEGGENLYERENKPDKNEAESDPIDDAERQQVGGDEDFSYQSDDNQKKGATTQIAGAFAGKRKYGWIGGGLLVTFLSILAIVAPTIGPLHIFNNFFNHNFEMNDSFRRQRTSRVIKSIFNVNRTNRQLSDTPFKLKADLVDFEKFESRMQSRGWSFEYDSANRPIGLINPDGVSVNLDNLTAAEFNRTIDPLLKETIPAWQMNKRVRTRNLVSTFTGPRRSFNWSKLFGRDKTAEPEFERARFLKESGLDDVPTNVDGSVGERQQAFDDEGNPILDENGNPTYENVPDADDTAGLDETQRAVLEAKNAGASDAQALAAGEASIRSRYGLDGNSLTTAILVLGCVSNAVYEQDLIADFERYASAMRMGSTYLLAVNEMQQGGDIDVGEVGELFAEYNNDDVTFAESAAWQRATGSPVVGPELDSELHVIKQDGNVMENVLGGVGAFFNSIPLFSVFCSFTGTALFAVVDIALAGVELIGGCLVSACVATAAKLAGQEAVFYLIGKLIAATVTNFVGFLIDNPVMAAGFLDQSFNLISSEENRAATPVDNAQYNRALALHKLETTSNLSFTERYFSVDNPHSLAFAFADLKLSSDSVSTSGLLATLAKLPGQAIASALTTSNVYAQADLDFDNYGFQKYKFDPAYLEVDAYTHAEVISVQIEADESMVTSASAVAASSDLTRDFAVLCMGFDPATGSVVKTSSTPMLPMFSDPGAIGAGEATRRNELYSALCVDEAMAQADLYAQVGRFVDDLELIESMEELSSLLN